MTVQEAVRFNLTLELVIDEIPEEATNYSSFPYIVQLSKVNNQLAEFNNSNFIWETFCESIIFWPLPTDLSEFQNGRSGSKVKFKTDLIIPKQSHIFIKPRALIYQDSLDFSETRLQLAKQGKLPLVINRIYSGEIIFVFRFKLHSITNIQILFDYYEKDVYYNGAHMPIYVTHWPYKKIPKQGNKRIVEYLQPLSKLSEYSKYSKQQDYKQGSKEFLDLDQLDYTSKGSSQLEDMKKYFKLPFKPYLIFVEVLLMAGNKTLSEIETTTPVPFSNNPVFDYAIKFDKVKVNQLPLEVQFSYCQARLAFNIKIASTNGENLILGCASLNVFSHDGKLVSGLHRVNVWPFHSIESNFSGIDPFCGRIVDRRNRYPIDHFCKIDLQFDTYSCDVFYTVRDEELLKELQTVVVGDRIGQNGSLNSTPTNEDLVRVDSILKKDPLAQLSDNEKMLLVKSKEYLKELPNTLSYYLYSVNWYDS